MSDLATAYSVLKNEGATALVSKSAGRLVRSATPTPLKRWRARRAYPLPDDFERYPNPPDPFAVLHVEPSDIRRFSGRAYPPYHGPDARLGVVKDGDWDRREPDRIEPAYEPRYELYRGGADRFSESAFFGSLEARLVRDAAWEETEWFRRSRAFIDAGRQTTRGITTLEGLERRCEEIDALFQRIERDGYRPQSAFDNYPAANTEVNVDVARDGTLLFVNGRNRLAIAKLLGIDTIPVGVYVRHARWMRRRAADPVDPDLRTHPDVEPARA